MFSLDHIVITFLNQYARRSPGFDRIIVLIAAEALLKGGVFMSLFAYAWFCSDSPDSARRTKLVILATFAGTFLGLVLARGLCVALPFRLRPIATPGFVVPAGIADSTVGWGEANSSFPSDHAVLFFGLSTGLFYLSWRLGVVGLSMALFVISLPRLYLGYHWPSDVVAGALLGAGFTLAAVGLVVANCRLRLVVDGTLAWAERHPGLFYAVAYLVSFEVVELFDGLRSLIHIHALIHGITHWTNQ
jgi:undecaprenyl-diphosphatase